KTLQWKIELNATVDGQDKTITEASVRRHLNLADADGTSTLPTIEIFKQLALMGYGEGPTSPVGTQHTPTVIETSPQLQNISITYKKTRTRTRRIGHRIPQFNVPSSVADEAITKEMHDGLGWATNTASSLEAEQGSGNISKTQTKATPFGPSSPRTSLEGGPECHERMIEEIDEDENINLVKSSKQGEAHKTAEHKMESDDTEVVDFSTASKAIMQESEPSKKIKKKEMIQISFDEEIAQRFYEEEQAQLLMDEEYAQQVQVQWVSDEARIAQENLAQAEEWDDVQVQVQADEDLAQRMLEEEKEFVY
nr:hypothetical protein [Tanacetum cinerariifolium]